ncbi:Fatty acyl-CoA reductase [Gryllus bimaculatus]|nr:Fatty acyl-CoA reductase [Gryllus bimaculatus]
MQIKADAVAMGRAFYHTFDVSHRCPAARTQRTVSCSDFSAPKASKFAPRVCGRRAASRGGHVLPWTVAEFYLRAERAADAAARLRGARAAGEAAVYCPDIDTVYVAARPARGSAVQERLHKLLDVPLFDRVRAQRPEALGRLQAVECDTAQPSLALAEADARVLAERVSVVFHLAASVRFDDPLITAVRTNACATRDLLELATRMTKLKLYPVAGDWRSILALVEAQGQSDPVALRALTTKILGPYCNTYTFSKNLAEHIVDHYSDRLPVGIVRPSVATARDPFPGWIDNFNGPMGLMVSAGKGVLHTGYSDPDCYIDYAPCDIVVKGIVLLGPPLVYHAARVGVHSISLGRIIAIGIEASVELPFSDTLYHPCGDITGNYLLFLAQFFFFHLVPAVIGDALLCAAGRKPMLIRLQRRIYSAFMALSFFLLQNWDFANSRFLGLEKRLRPEDREGFSYQLESFVPEAFVRDALHGTRRYLMKEPDSNLPQAIQAYKRKRLIHLILKTLFYATISWIILSMLHILLFVE